MQVAALAREIELVRSVAQPLGIDFLFFPFDGFHPVCGDEQRLVLELVGFDLDDFFCLAVKDEDLALGDILFAGHGVAIRLERGPRIGQGIDNPQIGHFAFIAPNAAELPRIFGPADADGRHAEILSVLLVLLVFLLFFIVQVAGIAVVLDPIGRQLDFLDLGIRRFLLGQGIAFGIHHE